MGLFGALIVRPTLGADHAYNRADSRFTPAEEFMVLLSEIDPYQHQAVEQGRTFNLNNYHPRYWLINGRGFPDSIADNGASWLPTQPYGALAQVAEYDPDTNPYPGLARYLNVGTEDYPFHPHGNNGVVIGRDGRPLAGPAGQDLSFEKFAINIGPGQTWDVLFKWYDAENYDPVTNPVPVTVPSLANQEIGMFYSGSPYLGSRETLPPGHPDAEPVRRVLHHLAQPRPVPDHLVGGEHDRSDHVHADRSARAQRLRMTREVGSTMTPRTSIHRTALSLLAGGALALMTVLLGPIGPAAAATVTIDLYAVTGTTTLPAGGQTVTVWGYNDSATAVNRPGGPTLVVTEGDTVQLTLHNQLTEPTALLFQGQAMVPDMTGAAAGGNQAVHLHGGTTRAPTCTKRGCCPTPSTRWRWACTAR